MALRSSWVQRLGSLFADTGGQDSAPVGPDPTKDWWWWQQASLMTTAGLAVSDTQALQLDVVQSILERLSGTGSTLPLMVFKRDGGERAPAPDHPLYKVIHSRPNDRQTFQEFWQEIFTHLAFWRNVYCEIIPGDDYAIGQLIPIHPTRLQQIVRGADGRIYYTFQALAPAAGHVTYRDDEIWHVRKPRLTTDGLRGLSMVETSRETFGRALAVEQFGSTYFRNGGAGGGVLKHPGNFKTTEMRDEFLDAWRAGGSGLNRHKDRLLLHGVDYTPFTVKNDEAQFLETLKEMAVKVCRLWNMPPHMVGQLDRATNNNIEQQSLEYVVYTLGPWINALEQAAARDLLQGPDADDYFVEFNVAGLLRGDFKTRMMGYAQARQWGWFSVNDIRRLENMAPIGEAGDRYLEPINMRSSEAAADAEEAGEGLPDDDNPAAPPPQTDMDPADDNDDPQNAPKEKTDEA